MILLYINVIISYSFKEFAKMIACMWTGNTSILWPSPSHLVYHVVWVLPSCFRSTRLCLIWWTILHGSTWIQRCPKAWTLRQYCFIFLHNTDANMLCRLFDDRKYMDICLPIPQEYCYLGKQKKQFVISHIILWTLVTFTFTPCKLCKMWADSQ